DDRGAFGKRTGREPSQKSGHGRSGGPADEQPLLPDEPPGVGERLPVVDLDELVDVLEVDGLRDDVLSDPLDEVRSRAGELVRPEVRTEDRPFRGARDDPDRRPVLLEVSTDPADGPTGSDRRDHGAEGLA